MSVDQNLLRRYRKSLVAVLLFIAYAIGLFVHNLSVQQRLEQNLLDAASLELAKQADAFSSYFAERHNALAHLATSDAVANYFAGHDLGMTVEYGLGVHTQAIEDRFEHLIDQERVGQTRIYERIVLIDPAGQPIAEAGTLRTDTREDYPALAAQLGDTRGNTRGVILLDTHDLLRFSQPVRVKDALRGHLIAYSPVAALEGRAAAASALRPEALVIASSGHPVSAPAPAQFSRPELIRLLAGMGATGTRRTDTLPSIDGDKPIAAIKQGIAGSPLALASLITQRELEAHAIPSLFLAAAGAVPFVVLFIVMLEMRERRQVERALAAARAEARAEAERLARTRSEFIANMSHEIRTPLNAVLGLAQIGQRDLTGRQANQQFVRIIDSGQHLLGIINDFLDCAKIEAGKLSVEHITIEPGQVIDSAVTLTAERAFARGLNFEVRENGLPARCQGDPLRLSQVLVNLLGNAIKFTHHGDVTLEAGVDGDMLHLRVSDTGVGMSPDEIARLFLPFEQADSSTTRRFGGTGLGLSISAHLVHSMGGTIDVSSHPGEGSRFDVRIPLIAPEFDSPPATSGRIVLAGFPPDEAARLCAELLTCGIRSTCIDAPAATPPDTKLLVVDARLAGNTRAWREWLIRLHEQRYPVALAGRLDDVDRAALPDELGAHLPLIERPLRSRHFIHCLHTSATLPTPGTPAEMRLAGISVLAVDDNQVNRLVLADMLEQEGAQVECLPGGAETLARLEAGGPQGFDIVLTDIQMPGMDGYELTRALLATHPGLPVLGLTAHAGAESRTQCLAAGMLAHVTKPIELDTLVTEILRHRRSSPPRASVPAQAAAVLPAAPEAVAVTAATASRLIDWPALDAQFKGKASVVSRIAGKAIITYRNEATHLRELAAGQGGLDELAFLAHNIKGSAGALKAQSIHELAAATDLSARAGQPDSRALAATLAGQLDELIVELEIHSAEAGQKATAQLQSNP
ncbi:hybrid sensor histidine kinase/response regulator [Zoogloea sp.]|uniref:hybrid sensor histidine kinase/response regulator n=1 Tax=Zoogloea sp. TaxID=49181 RepID=UPI002609EA22|nr:hybrid sensor histidine kinase/response regulator [Zoogloea sp.]